MLRLFDFRWCAVVGALVLMAGCASTRDAPFSITTPPPPVRGVLHGMALQAEPLRMTQTAVNGGHHEGMAQLRQPWIWNISATQRDTLYSNLKDLAQFAFLDELRRLGLKVHLAPLPGATAGRLQMSGELKSIELNTYGRGLSGAFEGFGSAGNYWDARIGLAAVKVVDARNGEVLWQGDIEQYAKLPGSPVKLDMTHFDLLANSLKMSLAGAHPLKVAQATYKSKTDYAVESPRDNPVELAARQCARDLVKRLIERLTQAAKAP
jgi:hypothetical protein